MSYTVAAFYQFVERHDPQLVKEQLDSFCAAREIRGTILLAEEGINGTVAATQADIDALFVFLREQPGLAGLQYKKSLANEWPFYRLKIKIKSEIVTLGRPDLNPAKHTGVHVKPAEWNALINDPETITIDTRNDFEVELGTFNGAQNPRTVSFRDFPAYVEQHLQTAKDKKIAMFCTGGIRCEKATAYMLEQGFDEVYQLDGGILQYLEDVPESESTWSGECFVFDQRVTVDHALEQGECKLCHACWQPVTQDDRKSADYAEGVSCPRCVNQLSAGKRASVTERQRQVELAAARNAQHIGQRQK